MCSTVVGTVLVNNIHLNPSLQEFDQYLFSQSVAARRRISICVLNFFTIIYVFSIPLHIIKMRITDPRLQ